MLHSLHALCTPHRTASNSCHLCSRVEVVHQGRQRKVVYKLLHFKNSEAMGEQEFSHKDSKLQQLDLLWVDQLHDVLAPGCKTMFFNTEGNPFIKSPCFSVFLKKQCWNIHGVNTCARDVRGVFVTTLRDFLAEQRQQEALDVLATLASLMMTSLRKWDSHYDRRQRLRREQEALALHAKYTARMLQDWRGFGRDKTPGWNKLHTFFIVTFVFWCFVGIRFLTATIANFSHHCHQCGT